MQRGSPSSLKEDSGDEEKEKRTTDQEGSGERKSGKEAPTIRTPRDGGGDARRPRELVRTQGRTWRWRRATGQENQPGLKGRAPPNRGANKPQEGTREELQEGPSREDRRDKGAQATKALKSGVGAKGRPQRDRRAAGKGLETKEEEEYHGSEGPAEVRASGRIAQEAWGPVQTTGRSSPGQGIDKPGREPSKELQEGYSSSSTATSGDKEDRQRSIDPKDLEEDRSCKETPVIRT